MKTPWMKLPQSCRSCLLRKSDWIWANTVGKQSTKEDGHRGLYNMPGEGGG